VEEVDDEDEGAAEDEQVEEEADEETAVEARGVRKEEEAEDEADLEAEEVAGADEDKGKDEEAYGNDAAEELGVGPPLPDPHVAL